MSVQAMAWVIENSQTRGNQYIVLLMIANRADEDGASAWPSIRWLARRSRLSERTVQRAIRKLEKGGALGIQWAAGPKGTNRYQVIMQNNLYSTGDKAVRGDKLTPRQIEPKGVTELCHPILPDTSNYKTPLPPASGGKETFLDYHGTAIAVKMGSRKRIPTPQAPLHPPYFIEFLNSKGFPARIVEKQ